MPTLSDIASMRETPRNPAWGHISDFLNYLDKNALQQQFGYRNPVTGVISEALHIPAASRVANKLSYGEPITNVGKANVPLIPEDTAEAAMFAAPIAGAYGKFAGKEALRAIHNAHVYGEGKLAKITPQPSRIFAPAESNSAFEATKLEKKGVTPEEIWNQLGVYRGPADKQWRKEINDQPASLKGGKTFEEAVMNQMTKLGKDKTAEPVTVEDVFHHPELFKTYPHLKNIEVRFLPKNSDLSGRVALDENGKIQWMEMHPDLTEKQSKDVLLHELQHPIQEHENWAVGGSKADFGQQDPAIKARNVLAWRKEVENTAERMGLNPSNNSDWYGNAQQKLIDEYYANKIGDWLPHEDIRGEASWPKYGKGTDARTQAEQLVQLYGLDKKTTPYTPEQMYGRLGGEVEARQVQARQDLSPEERQANFPGQYKEQNPYGYDTPIKDMLYLNRQGYFNTMDLTK